jgi:hypothetical protein
MTLLSPWQWFCSTRTLSNSLETVLTIVALNFWPWALGGDVDGRKTNSLPASAVPTPAPVVNGKQPGVLRTSSDITE